MAQALPLGNGESTAIRRSSAGYTLAGCPIASLWSNQSSRSNTIASSGLPTCDCAPMPQTVREDDVVSLRVTAAAYVCADDSAQLREFFSDSLLAPIAPTH